MELFEGCLWWGNKEPGIEKLLCVVVWVRYRKGCIRNEFFAT